MAPGERGPSKYGGYLGTGKPLVHEGLEGYWIVFRYGSFAAVRREGRKLHGSPDDIAAVQAYLAKDRGQRPAEPRRQLTLEV